MKTFLFIWDFHGTLEKNNVLAVQEIVNKTLKHFDIYREMTLEEAVNLYGLSWLDYFQYIQPNGNNELWSDMRAQAVKIQQENFIVEKYIEPNDYAREVLEKIKQAGHKNLLLSNTDPRWIRHFARLVKIDDLLDDFIGLDVHSEPRQQTEIQQLKAQALKKYLTSKEFGKMVKIGDRESDIEAGQLIGAVTYFYRNIYNERHYLSIKPDHEIRDLREILKEI
ncbi:MAG: HAD hydrolase-like protein [Patescibacteria group bacterium]